MSEELKKFNFSTPVLMAVKKLSDLIKEPSFVNGIDNKEDLTEKILNELDVVLRAYRVRKFDVMKGFYFMHHKKMPVAYVADLFNITKETSSALLPSMRPITKSMWGGNRNLPAIIQKPVSNMKREEHKANSAWNRLLDLMEAEGVKTEEHIVEMTSVFVPSDNMSSIGDIKLNEHLLNDRTYCPISYTKYGNTINTIDQSGTMQLSFDLTEWNAKIKATKLNKPYDLDNSDMEAMSPEEIVKKDFYSLDENVLTKLYNETMALEDNWDLLTEFNKIRQLMEYPVVMSVGQRRGLIEIALDIRQQTTLRAKRDNEDFWRMIEKKAK